MEVTGGARLGGAAVEAALEGLPSLIGGLERLSAALPPPAENQARLAGWRRTFARWLSLSVRDREGDLRLYLQNSGCDPRLVLSFECYRHLVPPSASESAERLFFYALEVALAPLRNENADGRSLAQSRVRRMLELARDSFGSLSLDEVASRIGASSRQLRRLFRCRTGVAFRRHTLTLRILRSVELLRDPESSIKAIAGSLGYADTSNFVREFRRELGMAPGQFRERLFMPAT